MVTPSTGVAREARGGVDVLAGRWFEANLDFVGT
jgi:hypothetical protein